MVSSKSPEQPKKPRVSLKKKNAVPTKKISKKVPSPETNNHSLTSTKQLSKQVLLSYLQEAFQERFKTQVAPKSWVLPNRAKFSNWLDMTFKFAKIKGPTEKEVKASCSECEDGKCIAKVDSLRLFPHQQFIVDYMQFASPYRGVLLLHHLGSGKSCSSIAVAEVLANNMQVFVLTPASLRGNYVEEVKKCGKSYYMVNQSWSFVSVATEDIQDVASTMKMDPSIITSQKGVWVPINDHKPPNFSTLNDQAKKQIQTQIDNIITNRIRFLTYNGYLNTKKNIREFTENGKINPFDNSCVVIDEIHNIISRVANKREIGLAVYKLLMEAKNCKLILLSGTPIINYPHEIAYIINLITGPRKQYDLKANKSQSKNFSADAIKKVLEDSKYVDRYYIDPVALNVKFELLPSGFEYSQQKPNITRSTTIKSEDEIVKEIIDSIRIPMKQTIKIGKTLPDDSEDFNKLFINQDAAIVTNQDIFAKRVLGTVSYYKTFSPDLYPSVKIEDVEVPLTDWQFSVYEKSRQEERRKESKSKRNRATGASMFGDSGQVYRFYSRANCNFVFPEEIRRPFPTSIKDMSSEVDMVQEGQTQEEALKELKEADAEQDAPELKTKKDFANEYKQKLADALETLDKNGDKYLTIDKLAKLYSPKFAEALKRIQKSPGTSLIYSQFRTVEGLGIIGMALKQLGWAELKLKTNKSGEMSLDIPLTYNGTGPFYTMFTGNNDESKMLLKIFNKDFETIPESIKADIKKHNVEIRLLMITQSGAEGISLKNVRQVHVMEPYWNQIRIDQVIGRAVRTCSHISLPPNERNVTVYLYRSIFSKKQLDNSFTIRTQDRGETSDQYIHNIAQRKAGIINKLLELLQKSSIDCALNAKFHGNMRCFSFPINMKDDQLTYEFDIAKDQNLFGIEKNEWVGQVLVTKKGQFLVRPDTNEVYDYDLYLESGRLVKLGTITETNSKGRRRIELRD